ncbi:DNA polymerase III subunit delta' [Radiobacillus sp. PE A8.2]|uniref:DNA polymerase III subunit delta' n=1 Tax=Radiobacillus sp. PE A8.2 TaxID=3380349 RepID=UPI00388E0C70
MQSWTHMAQIQPIASKMLKQSILKDRISHAYLFQGDKGTGKYAISLLLAKSIFCRFVRNAEPCHQCKDCNRIDSGNHPDVHQISPDGQSIKREQILHLQKEFTYTGLESNKKVYIIQEADKMTTNAANRLLKFLEEPSKQTTAILLTENSQALLPTIRSRCQIMSLKPLNPNKLQEKLETEGLSSSNAKLLSSMTNNTTEALELSNDEWFANARKIMVQLIEVLQTKPDEALLFINNQWMPLFKERDQLHLGLDLLLLWFKDIIYYHIGNEDSIVFINENERIEQSALSWSKQQATTVLANLTEAKRNLNSNIHPALVMEQLTLQIQR